MNYSLPMLTTTEVSERYEIPLRALKQYAELGIVKLAKPHPGTGTPRRLNIRNIIQAYTAWHLQIMGVNQKKISTLQKDIIYEINRFLDNVETNNKHLMLWPSYTELGPQIDVGRSDTTHPLFIGSVAINLRTLHDTVLEKLEWSEQ